MLELVVNLVATDLKDGSFDTPTQVRTAVGTTSSVFTNNPFSSYRDQKLLQTISAQEGSSSTDVTHWLVSTMNNNASGSIASLLRELNAGNAADQATALITWTALVKSGGPWDFKDDFTKHRVRNIIIGGTTFFMDVVANIHYGFVGAASGFNLEILLMGAGAAQIMDNPINLGWWGTYFDQPEDANAIILGYQLYEQYGANLTLEQFITVVQQYQYLLSPPHLQPE